MKPTGKKKIKLVAETLRTLSADHLQRAAGAEGSDDSGYGMCVVTATEHCASGRATWEYLKTAM